MAAADADPPIAANWQSYQMATEQIIIDGYNLIFRSPALRQLVETSLEAARDELQRLLEEAYRYRSERVTLVFDGDRDPSRVGRTRTGVVRVLFSEPPESADDLIRRLVDQEARRPSRKRQLSCRVVTSDEAVAQYARLSSAKAVGAESFVQGLGPPRSAPPGAGAGGGGARRRAPRGRASSPGPEPPSGAEIKPSTGGKRELDELERLFRKGQAGDDDEADDDQRG